MPVTAKLSSRFYQRLGDDVANELVGLLNTMDATYLSELRQLNEFNFARFDAKVEQRTAELRAETAKLRADMTAGFAELRGEMKTGFAELRTEQVLMRSELMKWTVGLLVPTLLGVIGMMIALIRLG